MQIDTLIEASWIVPVKPGNTLLDHAIAVKAGKIVDILPAIQATDRYQPDEHISCPGHIIIPGLINAHTHAAMNLLKGLADDLPLMEWLHEHIWPAEAAWLSESFVRDGTNLAIAEMIRSGTTTFNDMYLYPEVTAQCARVSGIRASIGLILIDFPTPWAKDTDEYLAKGTRLYDELKSETLITTTFAPHAPYTVSDQPMQRVVALANELDMPIHIHVHETAGEVEDSVKQHSCRPLERLNNLGVVSPGLQAVHMTQLNDAEIELAADSGMHIIHCPESNMKLASGICRVADLLKAGVNVALGTDGCASNNDLDLLGEMRSAAMLAKVSSGDASVVSAHQALEMATLNGAKALGIADRTGSLEIGKAADLVAIDLDRIETSPAYDPVSALVYAASKEAVKHVWVNGKQLLRNRQLTTLDEEKLLKNAAIWREKISASDRANE